MSPLADPADVLLPNIISRVLETQKSYGVDNLYDFVVC